MQAHRNKNNMEDRITSNKANHPDNIDYDIHLDKYTDNQLYLDNYIEPLPPPINISKNPSITDNNNINLQSSTGAHKHLHQYNSYDKHPIETEYINSDKSIGNKIPSTWRFATINA